MGVGGELEFIVIRIMSKLHEFQRSQMYFLIEQHYINSRNNIGGITIRLSFV